jgi:effector-binding domain-containing protein
MNVRSVDSQVVFSHAEETTLDQISVVANREVDNMYKEAERLGVKENGPMQFIYHGCGEDPSAKFTLEIAMAVDQMKSYSGKYQFKKLKGFSCATTMHYGDINKIGETYEKFMPEIYKNGKRLTDESREVYVKWVAPDSAENVTEIQVGIN